jgi:recombination protein RecA
VSKSKDNKAGKVSIADMRKLINKKAGSNVAFSLNDKNPTQVDEWIPTGSRWLDSIVCRGKLAGIPVGKVSEIAGLESTGKSYMAAQVAANAQKMGIDVIYFDSESAIDPTFLANCGCDVDKILYVQASSVEFVLETIEELLGANENKMLFVWDSIALTPSRADIEGDFNPQSSMAVKPRILSKGLAKLVLPIANSNSTLLCLNQLKTNITSNIAEALTTPYFTPGGKALNYSYSLRIWLTGRKAKASFVLDDKGYRIGSEVKVKLEKSRFGTQGRLCAFKILWGENIGVQDEESWLEAIKSSESISSGGAWYTLKYKDGSSQKFQASKWTEMLQDEKFKNRIMELMDEEVILKFDSRSGEASTYYNVDEELPNGNALDLADDQEEKVKA